MSTIEFIIDGDAPYIQLTISRNEAAILRAVLGEAQDTTLVDIRDGGFYSDLEDFSDDDLADISYALFDHLDEALGPIWESLDGDAFSDDPYEDFFEDAAADDSEMCDSDICPDCGENIYGNIGCPSGINQSNDSSADAGLGYRTQGDNRTPFTFTVRPTPPKSEMN
jgi:hypothetical protein